MRALCEAAKAHLIDGHREVERTLTAVVRVSEGATFGEALLASTVMTAEDLLRERKAAIRKRWAAVTSVHIP